MHWYFMLLLLMTGGVVAADEPETSAKDKTSLQGLWQAVGAEFNGQEVTAEGTKAFQVEFNGDQIVFNPATEARKHTFAVDPSAKPKAMDLTVGDGPKKGEKLPCAIYKLEGDKLTICLDKEGTAGTRPTRFKTAAGDGLALIVFERVKVKK